MANVFPKSYIPDEEDSGKDLGSDDYSSERTCFCCFFFAIPLVLCTAFVTLYIVYSRPRYEAHPTMPDRLPELYIPNAPAPDHRRPSAVLIPMAKPVSQHMAQRLAGGSMSSMQAPHVCSTITCRFVAQWLRAKFDRSARPCTNFYKYVCGKFKGGYSQFDKTGADVVHATIRYAKNTVIPKAKQTFYEKAAGLFQACLKFVKQGASEAPYLREWMISIGFDLNDIDKLKKLDPFDMIMRLSLDQGVPALLVITVEDAIFFNNNRVPMIEYDQVIDDWIGASRGSATQQRINQCTQFLQIWGQINAVDVIASDIIKYEDLLLGIQNKVKSSTPTKLRFVPMEYLANLTTPHVKLDGWIALFAKYTNNSFDRNGWMFIQPPGLEIVREMLDTVAVGRAGTNYIIFWNLYLRMVVDVLPRSLTSGKIPVQACYDHVARAVKVALITPCLQAVLHGESLQHATYVLQHVKDTIRGSIASSKLFNGTVGTYALQKYDKIKLRVGAPDYPNLTLESVEDFYKDLPDTNVDVLFSSWIKAMAVTARLKWVDNTTYRFDIAKPNAFFHDRPATVVIPAAIMMRPFFFSAETDPLNYGGVGALVGHEIMHALDVRGIMTDARGVPQNWTTPDFLKEYSKRTLCLRRSHRTAVKPQARQNIDDDTDSENLADFSGLTAAYAAFSSLPQPRRSTTLAGVNFTADQLFFISFCTQRCTDESEVTQSPRYAPFASRCNVPLMNMPAFSNAFGCALGDAMNPQDKCTFWD